MVRPIIDRSPQARLNRARRLVQSWGRIDSLDHEDQAVVAYAKFVHELRLLAPGEVERYLALKPILAELHYLLDLRPNALGLTTGCPSAQKDRALIKAFVLGDEDPQAISAAMDLRASTVEMFEYLGWDVRRRLANKAWIHNHVLSAPAMTGADSTDYERMFLLTVYRHGIDFFRTLVYQTGSPEELQSAIRSATAVNLNNVAYTAGLSIQPNNYNGAELLRLAHDQQHSKEALQLQRDKAAGGGRGGGGSEQAAEVIAETLQGGGIGLSPAPIALSSAGEKADEIPNEEYSGRADFQLALQAVLEEAEVA